MSFALAQDLAERPSILRDPLAMLPCSPILEFHKGQKIYDYNRPIFSVFLVLSGRVKASRITDHGRETVLDIYRPDEFFGESAFLHIATSREVAVALEDTKVMSWSVYDLEHLSAKRPELAIAMMQVLVDRSIRFVQRLGSFCLDNVPRRLAVALVYFSERFGTRCSDGSVDMIPLTHELLAQYVGTSRGIITHHMIRFSQQGLLRYTRKKLTLQENAIRAWLQGPGYNNKDARVFLCADMAGDLQTS